MSDKQDPAEPNGSGSVEPTVSGEPPSTGDVPRPDPPLQVPAFISWNECQGTGASIPYANALMLDEGETPPGWEPSPDQNDFYSFYLNVCQRISLGSFERGPTMMLIETHNGVNPPPACAEFNADYGEFSVLLSIWVDDPEVAQFLRDTYGLPVRLGTASVEVTEAGDESVYKWTWQNGTSGQSELTVVHPSGTTGRTPFVSRIAWHNGTGVSLLDLKQDLMLPHTFFPTAQGTLAPPMRYAERTPGPIVGLTSVWKAGDFYGPFYRFGDLECKQPVG